MNHILSLAFLGKDDADLGTFASTKENPEDGPKDGVASETRLVSETQRIVGIYGVKDEARQMTSLGFILKETSQTQQGKKN